MTANIVHITSDGKRLFVGYGYFDLHPQMRAYRRGRDGSWTPDKPPPPLPTDMDLLSPRSRSGLALPRHRGPGLPSETRRAGLDAHRWGRR